MKIKARPDDADMLESSELFQMNGWLAELRDEDRAESRDADRSGVAENGRTKPRGGGRTESRDGGRIGAWQDSRTVSREDGGTGSREDSRARRGDNSQAGSRGRSRAESGHDSRAESRHDSRTESGHDSRAESRHDSRAGSRGEGHRRPRDDGNAWSGRNGRAGPRDDGQANQPRSGHPRREAPASGPVTTPVTSTRTTARAVIGDQLRLPIMWCEMVSCISWFAHPAALGEADIRARAVDAGWRVDAVGLLACPQCVQTAPGFQSPLPVALWDREQASALPTQMADEPSAEVVAGVARELSHDLRCPASDHWDEVGAASAWIAAVPADDVARGASAGTSDEVCQPSDDQQPENHPRPGRHRKRLAARLTFASH